MAALKCAFQHNELCFSGDLTLLAQPKIFISWLRPPFRNDWVVYSKPSSVARRMCSRSGPSHPTRRHLQPSTRPACRPQGYLSLVRLCSQQLTEVGDPYRSMSYYVSSYCTCFAPVYMDFARNDTGEWEHRDFENAQVRFRSGNSGDGAKTQAGPLQTKEPVFDYNGECTQAFLPTFLQQPSQAELDAMSTNLHDLRAPGSFIPEFLNAGFQSNIVTDSPNGSSIYYGLQTHLSRRFSNGLMFQAAYTYSRTIDNSTADFFFHEPHPSPSPGLPELGRGEVRVTYLGPTASPWRRFMICLSSSMATGS